ncbi:MAG: hypothetical protein SPL13_02390 [Clostridia bacterium]|nr:hypothetical protein [Clostridia bacterium]
MKFFRISAIMLVVISGLITVFFGAAKISSGKAAQKIKGYDGIITVWQIDTFEGGYGSRRKFLADRAKEFSKIAGSLFLVTSHTKDSAEENFKNGIFPDILSYGCGIDVPKAEVFSSQLYFNAGSVNGKTYATPWCRGSYFLIKHGKFNNENESKKLSSVIVSQGKSNVPLMSAFCDGYEIEEYKSYSPIDAYKNFTLGKTPYLIGTQRDITRLKTREINFTFSVLNGFCDLYQYVSVTTVSKEKSRVLEEFIKYLLTEKSQSKLKDMFLLPVKSGAEVNGELSDAFNKGVKNTVSAFISQSEISETNYMLEKYFSGEKTLGAKIKNVLIKP